MEGGGSEEEEERREREELMEWLESPAHMEAFMAIASDAPAMRAALRSRHFNLQELLKKASSQVILLEPARPELEQRSEAKKIPGIRWPWITAIAASLAVVMLAAALYMSRWQTFETQAGEQRIVQLADGSVVRMNVHSQLRVLIDTGKREIRLSGEALFKVAPDLYGGYFRVYTDGATIQAVGTQFNVYEHRDGTTLVSVLEGKVQVTAPKSKPLPLTAGQQAQVGAAGQIEALVSAGSSSGDCLAGPEDGLQAHGSRKNSG